MSPRCWARDFWVGANRSGRTRNKLKGGLNGLALVSLAGPFSNVIMAVILAVVAVAALHRIPDLAVFSIRGVQLSLYLAIINMLPIPPLDGSKLLLAARIPVQVYVELSRYGFMLMMAVIMFTRLGRWMSVWSDNGARAIFSMLQ